MPFLRQWKSIFSEKDGEDRASYLAESVIAKYEVLLVSASLSATASQRSQLRNLILPGLALYQVMRETYAFKHDALDRTEYLFKATMFMQERKFTAFLNRIPDPFPIVKSLLKLIEIRTHDEALQEITLDAPSCFAFVGRKCFILDTLKQFNAVELTALFCKTDDWIAESMPKIKWTRTKTLANGDDMCDFRWEKRLL